MIKVGDRAKIIGSLKGNREGIIDCIDFNDLNGPCYRIESWWYTKEQIEIIEYKNDKPKQYKKGIDTMCRAESNMSLKERLGAVKWNIDKYNWREKGQDREDFIKIKAYCDYAIKQLDNERKQ